MSAPRIGIIGARRVRQGLGPFVVRDLLAEGAEVPCVLGTRAASASAAKDELAKLCSANVVPYHDLQTMLSNESLDALAILSPSETHLHYLEAALDAGLHVLCEKPLIWQPTGLAKASAALIRSYQNTGVLLEETSQWPFTLNAFFELHPELRGAKFERFAMRLSPASAGVQLLGDCLPHPLSLLQRLVPADTVEIADVRYERVELDESQIQLEFLYQTTQCIVQVSLELLQSVAHPRPAWFEVNGRRANREIQLPSYRMELHGGSRRVPLADPLRARIAAFVKDLRGVLAGQPLPDSTPLVIRAEILETLVDAYRRR